jgi:epoxyqueuosine reductase
VLAGERFAPRAVAERTLAELAGMTRAQYDAWVPGTALARAQYDGLRRNAAYALGAARDGSARDVLQKLAAEENEAGEAARWALTRLAP